MSSRTRLVFAIAALACGALLAPAGASAATIEVETTADESTENATCSLREALQAATTNSDSHEDNCDPGSAGPTVDFIDLAATTYTLTGADDENVNASGDLDVNAGGGPVIFDGEADLTDVPLTTISGGDSDRIVDIRPEAGVADVTIQRLILRDGAVDGSNDGGALRVDDDDARLNVTTSRLISNDAGGDGGAIFWEDAVDGYLFGVSQTEFSNNNADAEGGAIYLDTPQDTEANVETSSFVGNTAGEVGGAVYVESEGATGAEPVLQFHNSTLSGNSATLGGGALAFDFGLAGTVWFDFSTIANNTTTAAGGGGAILTDSDTQFVFFRGGNVISGNRGGVFTSNCAGPGNFDSTGYNIESANSCFGASPSPNDLVNTNPLLAPLETSTAAGAKQTTRIHPLYDGSPALNRIPVGSCGGANGVDQRYITRPQPMLGNCDDGAFEGSSGPAPDTDGDAVVDPADNCPINANATQVNTDGDYQGDTCDGDDDNDTVLDGADNCPTVVGPVANNGCPVTAGTPPTQAATKCKKKKKKKKKGKSLAGAAKKKKKKKGCKKKKKKKKK